VRQSTQKGVTHNTSRMPARRRPREARAVGRASNRKKHSRFKEAPPAGSVLEPAAGYSVTARMVARVSQPPGLTPQRGLFSVMTEPDETTPGSVDWGVVGEACTAHLVELAEGLCVGDYVSLTAAATPAWCARTSACGP
jgi:hypothetical protein